MLRSKKKFKFGSAGSSSSGGGGGASHDSKRCTCELHESNTAALGDLPLKDMVKRFSLLSGGCRVSATLKGGFTASQKRLKFTAAAAEGGEAVEYEVDDDDDDEEGESEFDDDEEAQDFMM